MARRRLGEPTKRDFQAIAGMLCEHGAPRALATDLARYFQGQNPRFSTEKFLAAVEKCPRGRR